MARDIRLNSMALLEWLYDNPGLSASRSPFASTGDELGDLVDYLTDRRLVDEHSSYDGADADIATGGRAAVEQIRTARNSPAQRTKRAATVQTHLLHWLDDQDTTPYNCAEALASLGPDDLGTEFAMRDIERAATYLRDKGLIAVQSTWQAEFLRPTLTDAGRTCITDFGGNVSDYLNAGRGGNTTNNFSGTFTGSNVSAGDHNVQNMTTGLDVTKVLEFAQLVKEALPALGLHAEDRDSVEADVAELQQQANSLSAEPSWFRSTITKILDKVKSSASTLLVTAIAGVAQEAIESVQTAITG